MKKFKIKARQYNPYFTVIVYDTLKEMRQAALTWGKKTGLYDSDDKIYGVCHCFHRFKIGKRKKETLLNDFGIIRIAKTHLGNEVISHELIHAALWIYRYAHGIDHDFEGSVDNACFGTGCNDEEENFAHIYGRLYRDFINKMYKHKIYVEGGDLK